MAIEKLEYILGGLMRRYSERVPEVQIILDAMVNAKLIEAKGDIENDHIAFRTIGVPQLGIQSLEKIFLAHGYTRKEYYAFKAKKLNAFWYAPPDEKLPRIFISELKVAELSPNAQKIIRKYTDQVAQDPVNALNLNDTKTIDLFLHSGLWSLPTWDDFQALQAESEYAAWAIYNRYYLNHFTISVHNLPQGFNTIELFNTFLEERGITLNNSGGKIKRSPDGLLVQSSTVAQVIEGEFSSPTGTTKHKIPGSYIEFAERKVLPQYAALAPTEITRCHRREGFEAANADKIFESTYLSQTARRSPS